MKNAAYDYKCVDDNIRYLKSWGAKHQLLVIIKRVTNYTQGLQFGRRDDNYFWRCITIMKEQPFKWRGIFDDELLSFKTNSNAFMVRRLYLETTDTDFYSQNNQQALQGRATGVDDAVQWGLQHINHHKRKFFSSGSRSICTRSSGRWHRANVVVWREEENREMDNGGVGTNSWYVRGTKLSW